MQFYTTAWQHLDDLSHEEKINKEMKRYKEYPPVDVDSDP